MSGGSSTVDLSQFILNLILFEKFILHSNGLSEFPALVRAFGYGPVQTVLSSKALDVYSDTLTVGQVGQTDLEFRRKKGFLPLGSYAFSIVRGADRKQIIHHHLKQLHNLEGFNTKQIIKLKQDLVARLVAPMSSQATEEIMQQLQGELRSNAPNITMAVSLALKDELETDVSTSDFSLHIHSIDHEDFHAETDIAKVFGLADEEVHRIVERGLLAVGGLNQRIAEMKAYNAVSGFRNDELPVLDQKLAFLTGAVSPEIQLERMRRVLAIKGFDDLDVLIAKGQVDLNRVLEIRETRECREFRDWLWSIDSTTDAEIEERVNSLRDNLSWFARGEGGRTSSGTIHRDSRSLR